MTYFRMTGTQFHGLATCRLTAEDTVWWLPATKLVFIVKSGQGNDAQIAGRAYLFSPRAQGGAFDSWLKQYIRIQDVEQAARDVSMSLTTLLHLQALVTPTGNAVFTADGKVSRMSPFAEAQVEMEWKRSGRQFTSITGFCEWCLC